MYCAVEELVRLTSSELPRLTLEDIIDQADRRIAGRLIKMDVGVPTSNDTLKSASLQLSQASVLSHPDSEQIASSIKLGDITIQKGEVGGTIATLEAHAWAQVDNYVLRHGRDDASRFYFRKVN